ncbi:hypothetical protein EDB85DRAFT_1855365 [Lactarius pseudohatsudake]|nr:hypothetical protein EDB85DRAFT_1855365 [Lactarius pseudohatsudake]
MTTWNNFLDEHATFPFPRLPDRGGHPNSAEISEIIAGQITPLWKAKHAIRDDRLPEKLCTSLEDILGDTPFPHEWEDRLLSMFGRRLQFPTNGNQEVEDRNWMWNRTEVQSRTLLDKGFLTVAGDCLELFGGYNLDLTREDTIGEGRHREGADFTGLVDDIPVVLIEAKSPSAMEAVGNSLPLHGFKLNWAPKQPLVVNVLQKAALYLGIKKIQWLFLTCHNHWVICRLVKKAGRNDPFLAYSASFSIENSSLPFRAFLGAILSTVRRLPVESSIHDPNMRLDQILEDMEGGGPLPEDDIEDSSGGYQGSLRTASSKVPHTCARATTSHQVAELMITSSSPRFPKSFQLWIHLRSLPANTFVLPENGKGTRRIWLTRHIGYGSTGSVWQGHFDNSNTLYAIKIVELLRSSDSELRQRLCNEFEVYLALEKAYKSGRLLDRITPHCHGAYSGDRLDALILELCNCTLEGWSDLSNSELKQLYGMVRDLHRVGIIHGDLEPQNVARLPGGSLRLIDFSSSTRHTCVEHLV